MVSLRRHFVPNPVSSSEPRFALRSKSPLLIHTRYDAAGNRTWKQNAGPAATGLDELYANDGLNRLTGTQRGTLTGQTANPPSPSITDQVFGQGWTLDGLGNFAAFNDNGTTQTRQTDTANKIQSITTGSTTTNPTYDLAGNLTSDGTLNYTYDAWNRQVEVRKSSDDSIVASYSFDGLNRRITKTLADGTKTDYFYNENWQVLEEQTRSSGGTLTSASQYVWDLSYIDTPVVRFRDTTGGGTFGETLYYTTGTEKGTQLFSQAFAAFLAGWQPAPRPAAAFRNRN
jgi:hypothetical protein